MKKTSIYISVSNEDNYLTIDGNLELLHQLLALVFCEYIICTDQNMDSDPVQEKKIEKE